MAKLPPKAAAEPGTIDPDDEQFHAWSDSRYIAAQAKLQALKTDLVHVERRLDAEAARQAAERASAHHMALAMAMVFGGEPPEPLLKEDLAKLREEQLVLHVAIGLAEKERDRVAALVSREICEKVKPAYLALNRRLLAAAEALVAVQREEERFVAALDCGGTSFSYMPRLGLNLDVAGRAEALRDQFRWHYEPRPGPEPAPAPPPPAEPPPAELQAAGAWTSF